MSPTTPSTPSMSATAAKTHTRPRLFTPGPVEIPVRILRAMSQVPPHHRTEVFRATYTKVSNDLKWLHQTEGEVLMLAASGTGAMEACVVILMGPGETADFEFTPSTPGTWRLDVSSDGAGWQIPLEVMVDAAPPKRSRGR